MPSEAELTSKEQLAWLAIRDNTRLARDFCSGLTEDEFGADMRSLYAVIRCLEIISEAARRLRGAQQARFTHLPWRQIEDSGNVYRHVYDRISTRRVWITVQFDLPVLLEAAEKALGA